MKNASGHFWNRVEGKGQVENKLKGHDLLQLSRDSLSLICVLMGCWQVGRAKRWRAVSESGCNDLVHCACLAFRNSSWKDW
jgi:hypothetical protein